jgi:Holliday junction DNA helicase RuvA
MIAKLHGAIEHIGDGQAIINVSGVGYLVYCSSNTLSQLSGVGEQATFFIVTHVREDHIHLYGFGTSIEQNTFELLTKVQGVGTKVALAILSMLNPKNVMDAVLAADAGQFSRVSGIGSKLADRIVRELKDRISILASLESSYSSENMDAANHDETLMSAGQFDDAVSALVNLGYNRTAAFTAVKTSLKNDPKLTELRALIAAALKELSVNVR